MPNESGMHSLQNYFGGGYEIATYIDHKVTKVADIIHSYWMAKVEDGIVNLEIFPFRMYKYYYIESTLYIFCATFVLKNFGEDDMPEVDIKKEMHVVQSIVSNYVTRVIDAEPQLTAKWNVIYVQLTKRDGSVQVLSRLDYRPDGESLIKINKEGIEFDKNMLDDLMKRLYQHV